MAQQKTLILIIVFLVLSNLFAFDITDRQGKIICKSVKTIERNKVLYIAAEDFSKSFPADTPYLFKIGTKSVVMTADNIFCAINDKLYNLSYGCIVDSKKIYFPLKSFIAVFNQQQNQPVLSLTPDKLIVDLPQPRLNQVVNSTTKDSLKPDIVKNTADDKSKFNINGITLTEKKNGTSIVLSTAKKFSSGDVSCSQNRDNSFYVTVYKGTYNQLSTDSIIPAGIVKKVTVSQQKQSLQISFEFKRELLSRSIIIQNDKIIINLITERAAEIPDATVMRKLEQDKENWKIDNIIIDPGHGGKDPGAVGKNGTYEKTITLKIAKYLQELLETENDIKVTLTRNNDSFVALNERTRIANASNGKLFVSIHCNANKNRSVSGFETFFLKPARTESALEVAALENSVIKYEADKESYKELTDHDYIVLSMMQANFVKESESWGSNLQKEIAEFSEYKSRGVDQAGFYVLIGASMPAVLVETGFISNLKEEKSLKNSKYQKQLAKAIYNSILNLKKKVESSN